MWEAPHIRHEYSNLLYHRRADDDDGDRRAAPLFRARLSGYNKLTAPNVYNTVSGVPPREVPFRAIDLGEVALRPHPT